MTELNRPTAPDDARPQVLIVDDSPDVHRLLRARLRHEDLELRTATSGDEGLAAALASPPAIIVLDIDMPGVDGFEVLRKLKNNAATVNIPVIMLSGLQSSEDKVTAFDLGAVDYITKPFDITELRVRLRSALRLATLLQMLSQRAQIDGLTGLWNRAYFDTRFADELAGCARHARPLALAMLDIDHFKSINDSHGHPAGDAVLQGFARVLRREIRQSDVACRYGGEEFALIMPDTAPQDAVTVCERIRTTLSEIIWPLHPERRVTVSIGITGCAANHPPTPAEWVHRADQNLYAAKRQGRNRLIATDPDGAAGVTMPLSQAA